MKSIEITTASKSLAEYTNDLEREFVVLTSNDKPVAAIVSLKDIDPEALALSTNQEFMNIIEQARTEVAAGNTISMDEMKRDLGL